MKDIIQRQIDFLEKAIKTEKNNMKLAERNRWVRKHVLHKGKLKGYQDSLHNLKFLLNGQEQVS